MTARPRRGSVLFDLGGVLLPFDRERRVAAIARAARRRPTTCASCSADRHAAADGPRRGRRGRLRRRLRRHLRRARSRRARRSDADPERVRGAERRTLGHRGRAAPRRAVGGFSDNPSFVAELFPDGALLDPMFFSSEIGACKPSDAAFAAAKARLGLPAQASAVHRRQTRQRRRPRGARGWDAILFTDNAAADRRARRQGIAMIAVRAATPADDGADPRLHPRPGRVREAAARGEIDAEADIAAALFSRSRAPSATSPSRTARRWASPSGSTASPPSRGRFGIYLEDLFVVPEARGPGAGLALMRRLAQRCRDEGLKRLEWAVLDWNAPTIAFYDRLGASGEDRMDHPPARWRGAGGAGGCRRCRLTGPPAGVGRRPLLQPPPMTLGSARFAN